MSQDIGKQTNQDVDKQTIQDFGEQWTRYRDNEGYYASQEMLRDICGPLLEVDNIRGTSVAEIGSGSGRIVGMLADAGANRITAVEPSQAMDALKENTESIKNRIEYIHGRGEELTLREYDLVFSIGVLHHIVDPSPIVRRVFESLRDGGQFIIWVYGREGNESYLSIFEPLRKVTRKLPDPILRIVAWSLTVFVSLYAQTCRILRLPMWNYMKSVILKLDWSQRYLVVFDQLNPCYAKYYSEKEAKDLLKKGGFSDVELYHRHGYSWTAVGHKKSQ